MVLKIKKQYVIKGTQKGKSLIVSPMQSRFTKKGAKSFLKKIRKNTLTKTLGIKNTRIVKIT